MIASESNRTQPSVTSPYQRSTATAAASTASAEPASVQQSILVREPFWFMGLISSAATTAAIFGIAAAVLGIVGLSRIEPSYMLPVAGLVLGTGFLKLATLDIAWERMFRSSDRSPGRDFRTYFGGMIAVLAAGIVAVVLCILGLVFTGDVRPTAIAIIAFGAGLFLQGAVSRAVSCFTHKVVFRSVSGREPVGPFAMNAALDCAGARCVRWHRRHRAGRPRGAQYRARRPWLGGAAGDGHRRDGHGIHALRRLAGRCGGNVPVE